MFQIKINKNVQELDIQRGHEKVYLLRTQCSQPFILKRHNYTT